MGNKYTTLGQGNLFLPLKSLKTLHIGGPFLQSVSKMDFSGLFGLKELVFEGNDLQMYENGSLSLIWPISHVTLSLEGVFQRNLEEAQAILLDVVHPNATLTLTGTQFDHSLQMFPLSVIYERGVAGLIFKNVSMSLSAFVQLVNYLSGSHLTVFALEDSEIFDSDEGVHLYDVSLDSLEIIFFKNIAIDWFYNFPVFGFLQSVRVPLWALVP